MNNLIQPKDFSRDYIYKAFTSIDLQGVNDIVTKKVSDYFIAERLKDIGGSNIKELDRNLRKIFDNELRDLNNANIRDGLIIPIYNKGCFVLGVTKTRQKKVFDKALFIKKVSENYKIPISMLNYLAENSMKETNNTMLFKVNVR